MINIMYDLFKIFSKFSKFYVQISVKTLANQPLCLEAMEYREIELERQSSFTRLVHRSH